MDHVAVCPTFITFLWLNTEVGRCDTINPDGSKKDETDVPRTYTHAMKLRSALTYGFGREYNRGSREWVLNKDSGEWEGNPSVSIHVARYMVALRKRKVI